MEQVLHDVLVPTLSLGAIGAASGSVMAVMRHKSIPVYAVTTSINCTIMGGSFFTLRKLGHLMNPAAQKELLPRTWNSIAAGSVTGALFNAFVRGPRGLGTAVLFYGSVTGAGEFAAASVQQYLEVPAADQSSHSSAQQVPAPRVRESEKSVWTKLKESSPLRSIPDDEFERMLVNKIEDLDEQITLTDEALVEARAQLKSKKSSP